MEYSRLFRLAVVIGALAVCKGLPARAADPEEAQYNVVVTLHNAGQWQAALKKIKEREALQLTDQMRVKYMYARGLALESGKKTAAARKAYEAVIKKYPKAQESTKSRMSLIYIDYAAKDYRSVTANCAALKQDGLQAAEKQKIALMNAGAHMALNEPKKAMSLYKQCLALGCDRKIVAPRLFHIYQTLQMHQELIKLSAAAVPGIAADAVGTVRTESLLAVGRNAEAVKEARKVKSTSKYFPRASFYLAQALIKQNKSKEAITPLTTAIRDLRNPPAPPSACLALAECLLADNRPAEADKAIDRAAKLANTLDEKEKRTLLEQAAIFRIRTASALHDNKKLVKAVDEARSALPADKLGDVLYARLFALHQEKNHAGVLRTLKTDLPVFQGKPQEGNAVLIYFAAYRQTGKIDEGCTFLGAFIQRNPKTPEAAKAKLELANVALAKEDFAAANKQLKELFAMHNVASHIGQTAFMQANYNVAAVAVKLKDPASAIKALSAVRKLKPGKDMIGKTMLLLGQVHAQTEDWGEAAKAWQEALEKGEGIDKQDLRDRLGRALVAAGRPAEAKTQFEALAKAAGGPDKLNIATREAWARALYSLSDFAGAGAAYAGMYKAAKSSPIYAYECAVCMERAEKWNDAEKWYLLAEKERNKLPPDYAKALPMNLSRIQFKTGTGDRGFAYWFEKLAATASDADFDAAVPALARIAAGMTPRTGTLDKLEALMKQYGPNNPRNYGAGAVALQLAAAADKQRLKKISTQLASDYTTAEQKLPANKWSTTVAPAMIHFFKGEAERAAGNHGDALVSYETVLAAYPYNEWPDAAACGAAECYAALGDTATAVTKLREVAKSQDTTGPSAKWIKAAKQRLTELTERKGK
ncbi:tetratricopeptide repeat protein [Verrucomicrobiota bacterium]